MENLFLKSGLQFEKISSGTTMPEDPNQWPQEILQELFKQLPYIADFEPQISMQKVDAERGYGFGHATVMNQTEIQQGASPAAQGAAGVRQARIPLIIRDGKLLPLDLLVTEDSKVVPLTEARLRATIFRPQMFDVTSKTPGDQSMIGQLYPPYRQNYGFGGGGVAIPAGMGKEGSVLEEYLVKTSIAGGKSQAEGKDPGDFPPKQIAMGKEVEQEHTSDMEVAKRIAADHLAEFPDYYTRLKKMEEEAKAAKTGAASQGQIEEFFKKHPNPPDKAVHSFAEQHGENEHRLEEKVYSRLHKELKEKRGSVLQTILPTINVSDLEALKETLRDTDVKLAYEKNAAAVLPSMQLLLGHEPGQTKFAMLSRLVRPTVTQLVRLDDGYKMKAASHKLWDPETFYLDRGEAIRTLGSKVVLAADLSGAATVAEDATSAEPEPDTDMQQLGPVTEPGMYKVQSDDGSELVGYVIPGLIDADGTEMPLSLFTNGSQSAVQADILGVPVQGEPGGLPSSDMPSGQGAFFTVEGDELRATVPMTIAGSMTGPDPNEPVTFSAETFDGRQVQVSLQPHIQAVTGSPDGKMLIPGHWQWTPLGDLQAVSLASSEEEAEKTSAMRKYATVEVISGGQEFSIRGIPVQKLANDQREFLNLDDAMFLLSGLGVEQGYGMRKLAQALTGTAPVEVRIGRYLHTPSEYKEAAAKSASERLIPAFRRILFKEAAVITDPEAVDVVLSLGFINPENITTFVNYLPELDSAQNKLCELLLAARLGLSETPEEALEKSVRATEEVLEGLKSLAFQGPAEYS